MSSSEITGLIKNLGFALESALFWARFAICCGNRLLAPASGALQGGNPPEPGVLHETAASVTGTYAEIVVELKCYVFGCRGLVKLSVPGQML